MDSKSSLSMLYTPEAQDGFWGEMDPDTRAFLDEFEKRETFTYRFDELPALFVSMASALPDVADLPVDSKSQALLVRLIPLLSSMPFRQCVFSVHWLNTHAKDSPMGWGTLCYLEALNIANNIKDHPHHDLSRVIVERISVMTRANKAISLYGQWQLKLSS
jgi:hypothetical protein